jgi:hypothetical protein
MNRLKGPDLKMPEMKVPDFLADLFYDLRDRRLLPLVALVVVAIVAVPFLLGGGSEEEEAKVSPLATGSAATASGSASAGGAGLTVVRSNPGLRDYRKRLKGRVPTNPFRKRYAPPNLAGTQLNPQTGGGSSESSSSATTTTVTTGGGSGSSGGGYSPPGPSPSPSPAPPPSGGDGSGEPHLTYYAFAVDVRITKAGGASARTGDQGGAPAVRAAEEPASGAARPVASQAGAGGTQEPVVRKKVLPLTPLPGEKAPVVTYMGSSKGKIAYLMVSNEVKSVFGDAKCASGDSVCQLLAVETGMPVTFVYGYGETRYTINVLKIKPVATGHS